MAENVSPRQSRNDMTSDRGALLVCAYDDEEKCRQNKLDGSISLSDLKARASALSEDSEIIFYCA